MNNNSETLKGAKVATALTPITITVAFGLDELMGTYRSYEATRKREDGYVELSTNNISGNIDVDHITMIGALDTVEWELKRKIKSAPDVDIEQIYDYYLDGIEFLNNADALEFFEALPAQNTASYNSKKRVAKVQDKVGETLIMYSVKFTIVLKSGKMCKIKFDPIIQSHPLLREFITPNFDGYPKFEEKVTNLLFITQDKEKYTKKEVG
jgi:hypothetical protein